MARRIARKEGEAPARRARPTLRDVARAAGTTAMTVSNVINGRAGQVGPELAARVLAICDRLGYRPHASARRLRSNRRMTIGVIIVDPSPHYLSDPFTAAVLAGINDHLSANGYSVVLQGAAPKQLGDAPLLRHIESDGICLVTSGPARERRAIFERVASLGQPVAVIQDDLPDRAADACAILQDDFGGGVAVARHLFARPVRHAAMLVPDVCWAAMERREAGVESVLASMDARPAFHRVRCGDESFDATQAAFADHIARHGEPDAVLGGNDRMAIAAMKLLLERGRRVPDDICVTGFNGFDFWRYASPELTTVRSPAFHVGERAARALLERLSSGAFSEKRVVLPVEFAPNRSSESRARRAPPRLAVS